MSEVREPERVETVIIFDSGDMPYQSWMVANPNGLVANTGRGDDSRKFTIHRALCGHIRAYGPGQPEGCFTTKNFIKVGVLDKRELLDWVKVHRPRNVEIKPCRSCDPLL